MERLVLGLFSFAFLLSGIQILVLLYLLYAKVKMLKEKRILSEYNWGPTDSFLYVDSIENRNNCLTIKMDKVAKEIEEQVRYPYLNQKKYVPGVPNILSTYSGRAA